MALRFVAVCILILNTHFLIAQEAFTVHVNQATGFTQVPALHSGAMAVHNGKWIFIGGRTNGLHGFYPALAFPYSGINSTVFVYDPSTDVVQSASLTGLPDSLEDPLSSSNMQFVQCDSILILCGGYGWSQDTQAFITYPTLIAINLNLLINEVQGGGITMAPFSMIQDQRMAVCGGEMDRTDTSIYLVFGHRFDGIYNRTSGTGYFEQHYTNQVRKFDLGSNWMNPSILHYTVYEDTIGFHRRDFNLVPQVFIDGSKGHTAFSGVFLPGIDLPFHDAVDIYPDSAHVNTQVYQQLNAYSTANIPVWDSTSNAMHTLFFGGMARYYPSAQSGQIIEDTLVPFVTTISRMSRWSNGTWSENWMPDSMPAYQGTNARFIPLSSIPMHDKKIVLLNQLPQQTLIGYLVGGMTSPDKNIADTDPSLSFPTPEIMEVWIEKTITDTWNPIESKTPCVLYPNPCKGEVFLSLPDEYNEGKTEIKLVSRNGSLIRNVQVRMNADNPTQSIAVGDLPSGLYYLEIKNKKGASIRPFVIEN